MCFYTDGLVERRGEEITDRIDAMCGVAFIARRPGSRIPTVGEWLGYLMRPRIGRVLILLGWWWLGWHYFAR